MSALAKYQVARFALYSAPLSAEKKPNWTTSHLSWLESNRTFNYSNDAKDKNCIWTWYSDSTKYFSCGEDLHEKRTQTEEQTSNTEKTALKPSAGRPAFICLKSFREVSRPSRFCSPKQSCVKYTPPVYRARGWDNPGWWDVDKWLV